MARKVVLALACAGLMIGVLAAPAGAKVNKKKFCAAWIEATAREEETVKQVKDSVKLLKANGPKSLQDEVTVVGAAALKGAKGDDSAFDTPKVGKALTAIGNYTFTVCAKEQVKATAVDYGYEGIPAELPATSVGIKLKNAGQEPHQLGLARVKDGVTGTAQELIQQAWDAGEQDPGTLDFVGGTFAAPGQSGVLLADLEPGRYLYYCTIPVGGKEGSPPHFTQGMYGEFTVTG